MHSAMNNSGPEQKRIQAAHLQDMADRKHERAVKLAGLVGHAAAHQHIWETGTSAEDYLAKLGFDLTKI